MLLAVNPGLTSSERRPVLNRRVLSNAEEAKRLKLRTPPLLPLALARLLLRDHEQFGSKVVIQAYRNSTL